MENNTNPRKFRLTLYAYNEEKNDCYVKIDNRFMAQSLAENSAKREIDAAIEPGDKVVYKIENTETGETTHYPSRQEYWFIWFICS